MLISSANNADKVSGIGRTSATVNGYSSVSIIVREYECGERFRGNSMVSLGVFFNRVSYIPHLLISQQ